MSLFIFIDDFLVGLTLGICMTPSADSHRVPREMTAYVVNSSADPVASLVPISAWAVFIVVTGIVPVIGPMRQASRVQPSWSQVSCKFMAFSN